MNILQATSELQATLALYKEQKDELNAILLPLLQKINPDLKQYDIMFTGFETSEELRQDIENKICARKLDDGADIDTTALIVNFFEKALELYFVLFFANQNKNKIIELKDNLKNAYSQSINDLTLTFAN